MTGHYLAMVNEDFGWAACGFGWGPEDDVVASQNYVGEAAGIAMGLADGTRLPANGAPCTNNHESPGQTPADDCGNLFGVEYCTSDATCTIPPMCFGADGVCTDGICRYQTPLSGAETCPAGSCDSTTHACHQTCHDADCVYCTDDQPGSCDVCGAHSSMVDGCCAVAACVIMSGFANPAWDNTWTQVVDPLTGQAATYRGEAVYGCDDGSYW